MDERHWADKSVDSLLAGYYRAELDRIDVPLPPGVHAGRRETRQHGSGPGGTGAGDQLRELVLALAAALLVFWGLPLALDSARSEPPMGRLIWTAMEDGRGRTVVQAGSDVVYGALRGRFGLGEQGGE